MSLHCRITKIDIERFQVELTSKTSDLVDADHKWKYVITVLVALFHFFYMSCLPMPRDIRHWLVLCDISHTYLHSAAHRHLAVPRFTTLRYGQNCLAVSGPTLCNTLPSTIRDPSLTLTQFCALLKIVLFSTAYEHDRSTSVTV